MTQADGLAQDATTPNAEHQFGAEPQEVVSGPISPPSNDGFDMKHLEKAGLGESFDPTTEGKAASVLTGWIRVDDDKVIRGWARDRGDPSARKSVDIYIDDVSVGVVLADRFEPRLQQVGEGDGRHAFAMVVPERFRTGGAYSATAFISGTRYALRSKKPEFQISAIERTPRIELTQIGADRILGRIVDGQYFKSVMLEAWLDGVRQDGLIATHDVHRRGESVLEFEVSFGLNAFAQLMGGSGVIAAPGMIEAGLSVPPIADFAGINVVLREDRRLQLRSVGLLEPAALKQVQILVRATGEPSRDPVILEDLGSGEKPYSPIARASR